MSSILDLNKENAPIVRGIREAVPFQNFFFHYDCMNKPEGRSKIYHLLRSAVTIIAKGAFIAGGLVEKIIRFACRLIQKGIDLVLTEKQQNNIKEKAKEAADDAKEAGKSFYQQHFAPLFA